MAFIQALQVVGHLCCQTKQMFHISRTTLARTYRHVHGVCRTPGGISTTTIQAFCMWHVRKQPLTIKPILKIGNLKTQMTAHWRTHTSMSPSGENPTPSWLYVLTFRVSVQAYRALSVTLYLLRQHLFILCIKQTVIVGHNIADLRLIYVLHCREWCYYGKSMSLLLFRGAGRGVHTAAPIIQLLTLLSRAERERRRDAAAKRPTVLFIKALSSPRPATDVWHHTMSPASTTGVRKSQAKMARDVGMETWQDGGYGP